MRRRMGNVPLTPLGMAEAIDQVVGWAGREPMRLVVTPNVDHIMTLQKNERFRQVYERADLSLADGMPVVLAARWLGLGRIEKVSGSDLAPALCRRGASEGWRIFFAGGPSAESLADCLARIERRYPGLKALGHWPPPGFERDPSETEKLLATIDAVRPDILMMACGAPKSEIWLDTHRARVGRGVALGIGIGLHYLAGLEPRAPRWMQRASLEWLWRVIHDPRRLWRRYLVDDMKFFPLVWRWKRRKNETNGTNETHRADKTTDL
jgi:N-acetylglucosaminyldiphosphoundecaprenol N-acetyl-beta-D-mannosaminyltransferase